MIFTNRYWAVYNINFFKKLNSNLPLMLSLIFLIWLLSIIASIGLRYAFQTTYFYYFCLEGNSENLTLSLSFMATLILLSTVLPTIINTVLYFKILRKVRSIKAKALEHNPEHGGNLKQRIKRRVLLVVENLKEISSNSNPDLSQIAKIDADNSPDDKRLTRVILKQKHKHSTLAKQVFLINIVSFVSSIFMILINIHVRISLLKDYFTIAYDLLELRVVFRILFLATQSIIPIFSVYFVAKSRSIRLN